MRWSQPKRNVKNPCGHRGQCSCQRRVNAELARSKPGDNGPCTAMCGRNGPGEPCNGNKRSGCCPCPFC